MLVLDADHPPRDCGDVLRQLEQVCVTTEYDVVRILSGHRMIEHAPDGREQSIPTSIRMDRYQGDPGALCRRLSGPTLGTALR